MNEYQHFNDLREKYFNKKATPDEVREFTELFESGKFNDMDQEAFNQAWDTGEPSSRRDKKIFKQIYSEIHPNAKPRLLKQPVTWIATAATILVFLTVGNWYYNKTTTAPIPVKRQVSFTGPDHINLPDSSSVELKAGSTLSYNEESFGKTQRAIILSGTACFDVKHNPKTPFRVQSGHVITTVLGTVFNISQDDHVIEVTVLKGKVTVGDSTRTFHTVSPNEKITVMTQDMSTFLTRTTNAEADLQWKKNYVVFDGIPMHAAIAILEKRFEISINFENPGIKNCPIEAEFFNDESLSQILNSITAVHDAKPVIHGNSITIEGGTGCD